MPHGDGSQGPREQMREWSFTPPMQPDATWSNRNRTALHVCEFLPRLVAPTNGKDGCVTTVTRRRAIGRRESSRSSPSEAPGPERGRQRPTASVRRESNVERFRAVRGDPKVITSCHPTHSSMDFRRDSSRRPTSRLNKPWVTAEDRGGTDPARPLQELSIAIDRAERRACGYRLRTGWRPRCRPRDDHHKRLADLLKERPSAGVLGQRQSGYSDAILGRVCGRTDECPSGDSDERRG